MRSNLTQQKPWELAGAGYYEQFNWLRPQQIAARAVATALVCEIQRLKYSEPKRKVQSYSTIDVGAFLSQPVPRYSWEAHES